MSDAAHSSGRWWTGAVVRRRPVRSFATAAATALLVGVAWIAVFGDTFPEAIWMRAAPPPLMLAEPVAFAAPGGAVLEGFVVVIVGRDAALQRRRSGLESFVVRLTGIDIEPDSAGYRIAARDRAEVPDGWVRLERQPRPDRP